VSSCANVVVLPRDRDAVEMVRAQVTAAARDLAELDDALHIARIIER
jgi:hypothetical protein